LSTVYAIVRNSGGQITVDSELGLGTAFHIDWPRVKPPEAARSKPSIPVEAVLPEERSVLLVEDVTRVRELLVVQLQRAGYRVRSAANGVAALEQLAREHFDLVLSDMVMPQMGGLQLAQELQRHYPDVRYLLMTGYAPDALQAQDKSPEPTSILRKPFSNDDLLRAVRRALATRRS
jgi:two-component system, cell cycle sensor histidine kinase and response regulator CckA